MVEGYCSLLAYIFASMSKTATTGGGNLVACGGTLVTGNIDNLNNVGGFLISAHGDFYTFLKNSPLLINAAAHCRSFSGNDSLRDI